MKIKYFFRVRVGKQTSQLTVVHEEGYSGDDYTISNGKIIKFRGFCDDVFKINEKKSRKRWPKYIDCTINKNGLQVEYKGHINNIDVGTHINPCTGYIDIISFEAYE